MAERKPRPNDETRREEAPAGRMEQERVTPQLTHQDFKTMPLDQLADRIGLSVPQDLEPHQEREWREQAWANHVRDVANRDEWGTATQTEEPPQGEEPNL